MIRKSGAGILIHGPGTSSWLFRLHALMWHEAKWVSTQERRRTERKILKRGEKGRPSEKHATQSHFCAQQDHEADPPVKYAKA